MPDVDPFWLRNALGSPQRCAENVTRKGEEQPCDRTAVALRVEPEEPEQCYPVCGYHARADMVTLEQIVRFFLDRREAERTVARGLIRLAADVENTKENI